MPTVFSPGDSETWRTYTRLCHGQLVLAWSKVCSSNSLAGKVPEGWVMLWGWKLKLTWAVSTACGSQKSRQRLELELVRGRAACPGACQRAELACARGETEAHCPQSMGTMYFSYRGTFSKPDAELVPLESYFAHVFLKMWLLWIFQSTGCHAWLILQCRFRQLDSYGSIPHHWIAFEILDTYKTQFSEEPRRAGICYSQHF